MEGGGVYCVDGDGPGTGVRVQEAWARVLALIVI